MQSARNVFWLTLVIILGGCAAKIPTTLPHSITTEECDNVQGRGKVRWSGGSTLDMTFLTNGKQEILFHIHDLLGRRVASFALMSTSTLLLDHQARTYTWILQDELCIDQRFCFIDAQLSRFLAGKPATSAMSPHCTQQDDTLYRCESDNHWVRLTIRERTCSTESPAPLEIPGGYRELSLHRTQLR